jgi:hypothetical protein
VVADLGRQALPVGRCDIRQVRHEDVDVLRQRRQEVAAMQIDAVRDAMAFGVPLRDGQGFG